MKAHNCSKANPGEVAVGKPLKLTVEDVVHEATVEIEVDGIGGCSFHG